MEYISPWEGDPLGAGLWGLHSGAGQGKQTTGSVIVFRCWMGAYLPLFPEAVKSLLASEEDAVVGQRETCAVAAHGQVAELGAVQKTELFRISRDDEDFAIMVLKVDLAVPTGRRGLDLGAGADFTGPEDFAGAGFDAGEALVLELAI